MNDLPLERLSAKAIFTAAVAMEEPQQRNAYLNEVCGDVVLRQKVEQLLTAADGDSPNPLDRIAEAFGPVETLVGTQSDEPAIDISTHPEIGPYKLLEQIGEGGMGVVFMAQQTRPVKRRVALKLVKPGMDSREVVARFEAERQALAMMDHPHISRVLDAGATPDGRPYFVMELVRGVPITEYCDRHRLTIPERLRLFINVCHAVQHAHLKGVIHRDLKPSNVLVTQQDGQPMVKVIDFGVAKAIHQELTEHTLFTRFAQVVGTPLYMSPEQVAMGSLDIDTRSDIYSLGVLLYELLTGETPFDGKTLEAAGFDGMRQIIREREPARPSARISTLQAPGASTLEMTCREEGRKLSQLLRGDLDWIVMQALDKDRSRRYQTATALADDVARFLGDQPVLARPPSFGYRLRKYSKRHRVGVSLSLVVFCAMVVAGVSLSYAHQRNASASAAEGERLAEVRGGVDGALQSARAGIEAESLPVAERWLESARVLLERDRAELPDLALQVDELQQELEQRVFDAERYAELLRLAREAQDKMTYGDHLSGDVVAIQALELFHVEESADWIAELEQAYLTGGQKTHVREVIYETLLCLADYGPRWHHRRQDFAWLERSLRYAELASRFHEPTRALHFARHKCYLCLGDQQHAEEARKLYEETPATIALDHYLPGHTAGWDGDLEAARSAYWAALQLQPDHYNSLFFLGARLAKDGRHAEAVAMYTGCIALRPDHVFAYTNRADSQEALGELEKAEETLLTAIQNVPTDDDELWVCYKSLCEFYQRTDQSEAHLGACHDMLQRALESLSTSGVPAGWTESSRFTFATQAINHSIAYVSASRDSAALRRLLEDAERVLNELRSTSIRDRDAFLTIINNLGVAWMNGCQESARAVTLIEEAAAERKLHFGPLHVDSLTAMTNLAWVYLRSGQSERSLQAIDEFLALLDQNPGIEDAKTLALIRSIAEMLGETGTHERTIPFIEEALTLHRRVFGETAPETMELTYLLGVACHESFEDERALELFETFLANTVDESEYDAMRVLATRRLAQLYINRGEGARGAVLFEEAYEFSVRVHGADHPETLNDLKQLASVLVSNGDWEHADELLTEALEAEPMARGRADYTLLWAQRGLARLGEGRREDACSDFRTANLPDAGCFDLSLTALGFLAAGDHQGRQDVCTTLLNRSRELQDAKELHWAAWACALGTYDESRGAEIRELAEDAVKLNPGQREALVALGAIQYRQGDLEQAVQTLLAAEAATIGDVRFDAYAWFFLALAHHELGNDSEAVQWRQKTVEYVDQLFNESDEYVSWSRRKTLELLRDEMEQQFAPMAEVGP